MQEQWTKISHNLKKMLDSGTFKVWITPLQASIQGHCLRLCAPNAFMAGWVQSHLAEHLREAAAPVLGVAAEALELCITTAQDSSTAQPASAVVARVLPARACPETASDGAVSAVQTKQAPLPLPAPALRQEKSWRYSFADFVVGPCNNVAVAAAQDMCRTGGDLRTLFVNSASGLGKTHLAQAVGQSLSSSAAPARVGYLTAEEFAGHFVSALRRQDVEGFKSRLRELDVLLLEDVHFFQGKEKMQAMALAVVKSLQARGSRVIFTSSFSPRELQNVDSQLVSYFCSGILTQMSAPDADMRREILTRKAKSFQVLLPDAVCDLLATRLSGDVRQLESCLNSMIFKARVLRCGLNLELAQEVMQDYACVECHTDMDTIIRLVCESYGLTPKQLSSSSRRQECVLGRNTAYYLARKHTELSLTEIGSTFNRRHSTVIKGITSVERELSRQSPEGRQIARTVELIERNAGIQAPL